MRGEKDNAKYVVLDPLEGYLIINIIRNTRELKENANILIEYYQN